MTRWQDLFETSLQDQDAIGIAATVAALVGREPTRSEMTAARRAAHRYAATGKGTLIRVPSGASRNMLVLTRPGLDLHEDTAFQAATSKPRLRPRRARDTALLVRHIERAVETAAADGRRLDSRQLDPDDAAEIAAALTEPLAELGRLRRRLLNRAQS